MRLKVFFRFTNDELLNNKLVSIVGEPTDEKCAGAVSEVLKLKSAETVEVLGWELA